MIMKLLLGCTTTIVSCSCVVFLLLVESSSVVGAFVMTPQKTTTHSASLLLAASTIKDNIKDEYDVVVIGSGIGGLSAAAMCAKYGFKVAVFESHYRAGGAAHGFTAKSKSSGVEYHFDTGPSFFAGLNSEYKAKSSNPLRTILDFIDEKVECIPYTSFGLHFPEGEFVHSPNTFQETLETVSGPVARLQWQELMKRMDPIAQAVAAMPTAALRFDVGAALTAGQFMPNFGKVPGSPFTMMQLTKPFSNIVDRVVTDKFTKNWLDLLCFCLSGLPANGTITAEMGMMMGEFYEPDAVMDCPVGGAKAIVEALIRGIEKNGGSIFTSAHVKEILVSEEGKATGIKLKQNDKIVSARKSVISNLSVWDLFTKDIIDKEAFPQDFLEEKKKTPLGKSFMHLHIGFKASREELEKLQAHYMYMDDWDRGVDAEDNAALLSIPSVHDSTLAPDGHAVLHIYTPATENYSRWEGISRSSKEYDLLKEERVKFLWTVLEKVIPDIRQRADLVQVGTPLTHERFLRRFKGSYGPAIVAGEGSFPFPQTPVKNLLLCGDSCFPGIGVPAVSGSGLLAANSVSLKTLQPQLELLKEMNKFS